MIITLRKRNVLTSLVILLAIGFVFVTFKDYQKESAGFNSLLQIYAGKTVEEEGNAEDELRLEDTFPMPVSGHPLNLGTNIDPPDIINYFMEYKLERDRIRSRQVDILREIVNNPNSVTENRLEAQQRLFIISDNLEKELELENLLAAKGFVQSAVLIQPSSVTIVIGKSKLTQEEVARIADLAVITTAFKLENVIIIPLQGKID